MAEPLPETETDEGEAADDSQRLRAIWEEGMHRFDSVAPAQIEMRALSLRDRRCIAIEGAWWEDELWSAQYENMPRPEMDKVAPIAKKLLTDYRENRIIADFIPTGDNSDDDTAETLDGMYRADSHDFYAQEARDNAFSEASQGGFGAYRLTTDYADSYDPGNDSQRVNPGVLIGDADQCVYFDPADKSYGKRNAKWAFVISYDPRATVEARWGADALVDFQAWRETEWTWRDWYRLDTVQTAEYYVVEEPSDMLIVLSNKLTSEEQRFYQSEVEGSQVSDLVAQGWSKRTRSAKRKRIHKYVMNGAKVLKDCGYIAGDRIPIVPVYGERDFVDGMERWRGVVRKLVDAQRAYHASLAKVIEMQALAPYEVPIVAPEQMNQTIADQWARGNIDRTPYRQLMPIRNEQGEVVNAGPIGKIEPPQVQPATVTLLQMLGQGFAEQNQNADEVKANVSADAMDIAAARVDAESAMYLDNMRLSVTIEGEIYLGMAREVYYEPGRKVPTLSNDNQDGQATLAEPTMGTNNVYRIRNDITTGTYKVVADVQESTATKRQKTVRTMVNLATVATNMQAMDLAKAFLITAVQNEDGEGMANIKKLMHHMAVSIGLDDPTDEEKQQIQEAQAAQAQGQQPAPADQALLAQAGKLSADATLSHAKAVETLADAHLKNEQAETLSKAPRVPSGLDSAPTDPSIQAANDTADIVAKHASARLDDAKADHLIHDIHDKRIRTGHEIEMERLAAQREQAA